MITDAELRNWCDWCRTPLAECRWNGEHPDPLATAKEQVVEAAHDLDRHPTAFVRWPWKELDALTGGMAPGQLHYVVGASGLGKTTFITSAIARWADGGRKIVVLPLEVRASVFRTYLAAQSLGVDPGLMLSGDYTRREDARELRARVAAAVRAQLHEPYFSSVTISGAPDVTVETLKRAAWQAEELEAEILVIDHVDHLEPDPAQRKRLYEASVEVNRYALRLAQDHDLLIIAMSQANLEALRGTHDHLAKYAPLRDTHVLNGGHKRQIASGMLGLYRPLLAPPEGASAADLEAYRDLIAAARRGEREPHTALEPNVMGVNIMKSRAYGSREGKRITLSWDNGRIVDRSVLPYSLRVVGSGERRHA